MAAKAGLAVAALLALASCGSGHPKAVPTASPKAPSASASSASDPVTSWAKGGGLDKIEAITTDIAAIHDAGPDASKVRAGCAELETSASAGQFYRKMPLPQAQQHWAAALAAFKKAAGECLAAIDENQPALLKQTSADLDTGTTELAAATKELRLG